MGACISKPIPPPRNMPPTVPSKASKPLSHKNGGSPKEKSPSNNINGGPSKPSSKNNPSPSAPPLPPPSNTAVADSAPPLPSTATLPISGGTAPSILDAEKSAQHLLPPTPSQDWPPPSDDRTRWWRYIDVTKSDYSSFCSKEEAEAAQHFIARYARGQHLLCYEVYDANRFPGAKEARDKRALKALQWLLGALFAAETTNSPLFKKGAKALLGTFFSYGIDPGPAPYFMPDGKGEAFQRLCKVATERLEELGSAAEKFYRESKLASHAITKLGATTLAGQLRQTDAVSFSDTSSCGYVFFLALASIAINASFQKFVRETLQVDSESSNVDHRGAPTKGYERMWNKLSTDHKDDPEPKAASNIDTIRCAVVFETADDLCKGFETLDKAFGGVKRTKNNYRSNEQGFNALETTFGYRAVLINVVYDCGMTWGELARSDEVQKAFQPFLKKYDMRKTGETVEWQCMQDAIRWMTKGKGSNQPARLCGEVQMMLRYYLNMRKKTHLYYKVMRAHNGAELHQDCRDANADKEGHAEDNIQHEMLKMEENKLKTTERFIPEGCPSGGYTVTWKDLSESLNRFFKMHSPSNLEALPGTNPPQSKADKMFAQIVARPDAIPSLLKQLKSMFNDELDIQVLRKKTNCNRVVPNGCPKGYSVTWKDLSESFDRFFEKHSPSNLEALPGTNPPQSKADKMFAQIVARPDAIPSLLKQLKAMFNAELDVKI
eukprot:g1971.t1